MENEVAVAVIAGAVVFVVGMGFGVALATWVGLAPRRTER